MTDTIEYKPLEKKFIELLKCGDHKKPLELLQLRIYKLGYGNKCVKCSGSGQYAHYGVCFSCNGAGRRSERLTKALYAELEAAVQEGALDHYFEDIRRKAKLKAAANELFTLMNDNALAHDYTAAFDMRRNGKVSAAQFELIKKLRFEQVDIHKEYTDREVEVNGRAFRDRWTARIEKMGDKFDAVEFKELQEGILEEKYKEIKEKLEKINASYEGLKAIIRDGLI